MSDLSKLRWLDLWHRIDGKREDGVRVYDKLVTCYTEPHRAYHTLGHINHGLDELMPVKHLTKNLEAVEFAFWYHDEVYDVKVGKLNEWKSTVDALKVLENNDVPKELPHTFRAHVANLILATLHDKPPTDPDAQLVCDLDLSGLGQSPEKFDEDGRHIRVEYSWVPDDIYARERAKILSSFLARPRIYATEFFRDKYENAARANLARAIAELSKTHCT